MKKEGERKGERGEKGKGREGRKERENLAKAQPSSSLLTGKLMSHKSKKHILGIRSKRSPPDNPK